MNIENIILDSLEIVSNWDLSDERLADAIADQAMLLAGVNQDELWEDQPETH